VETRDVVPTIRALRDHADRLRRHELERAVKLLAKGEDPKRVLETLSHGLTNKLLHGPTHALNQSEGSVRADLSDLVSRLYQLHHPHTPE
jgi:glutamyl-tRNA reductase